MSRDMIAANMALFAHLTQYCAQREEALASALDTRWVANDDQGRDHLKNLKVVKSLRFSGHQSITLLSMNDGMDCFIGLIGFDLDVSSDLTLRQVEHILVSPGMSVCLLSELLPRPRMGPATIRNAIEANSKEQNPDYNGHEQATIESLFPAIQVVRCVEPLDDDAAWRVFLMLCAEECGQGASWVDAGLAESLVTLTDLNVPDLPYGAICRSMFDADPRSLFMSLYRCIEATYAYDSSRKLMDHLAVGVKWPEVAAALEGVLGWRPQEASSLNSILSYAIEQDLRDICTCLNSPEGDNVAVSAGKAIYSMRNSIVHYRPGIDPVDVEGTDWNRLCSLLVAVIFHVFTQAYE